MALTTRRVLPTANGRSVAVSKPLAAGRVVVAKSGSQAKTQDFQADFYEITQQLEALKNKLESASSEQPAAKTPEPAATTTNSLGYVCDESGCVLLSAPNAGKAAPAKAAAAGPAALASLEEELQGNGWVLGLTGEADVAGYCGVVGGAGWSVSLTQNELRDFVVALHAIRNAITHLTAESIDTEEGAPAIKVKWNTKTVTMEATPAVAGQACTDDFRLSFNIGVGGLRLVSASWTAEVVRDVLATLDKKLPGFSLSP